jgi:hypothetical protein
LVLSVGNAGAGVTPPTSTSHHDRYQSATEAASYFGFDDERPWRLHASFVPPELDRLLLVWHLLVFSLFLAALLSC